MNITLSEPGQSEGLIFVGPYRYAASGPRIYDKQGNLVWDGYGLIPPDTHNVHLCYYQDQPHLCMTQCDSPIGYGVGQGVIVDSNYKIVQTIHTGNAAMPVRFLRTF